MVRLVTADAPHIVALQEVPLWALGRLERWTGMAVRWAITVPALLVGPLGRLVTEVNPVRLRALITGQANVLLLSPRFELGAQRLLLMTPGVSRWDWLFRRGIQQRYCQAVDVQDGDRTTIVANLHTTNDPARARGEVALAAAFVHGSQPCILFGDFNIPRYVVPEFSTPIDGIDQILVRGLEFEREPEAWGPARRRIDSRFLSDHAPVEAVIS
jgi:endonuclease/exonuclease/phosphatase family metal-dependent hydrolase